MQYVKMQDLKPGMRLAKPIYNKMGVMLYERDTKLTAQGITNIANFNLLGIYILEPAEPVPPLSNEDIAFEQFQTITMFQLRSILENIIGGNSPEGLHELITKILVNYGSMDHKINYQQNIRSTEDYVYKHAISTAILAAMITHVLNVPYETKTASVTSALLYDIGYLLAPEDLRTDSIHGSVESLRKIQEFRKLGFERLNPKSHSFLDNTVLKMISQLIYITNPATPLEKDKISLLNGTKILKVADAFDRMTSMNLTQEPMSEVTAIQYLFQHPELFDSRIVSALAASIHLLPAGSCVDLSDGEKALVLTENPNNFMQPVILKFSDNRIYDLQDPEIAAKIQIRDSMKTMDNRVHLDEESLKHFRPDEILRRALDRFRKKKAALVRSGRYDTPDPVTIKKPAHRVILK